jgi:hypothetical protein
MRPTYILNRWTVLVAVIMLFLWAMSGCSKDQGPDHHKTDTFPVAQHHDSAKFYVTFDLTIANTSGVYQDTFYDGGSMIIYVVDGVVKIPPDSILNLPPFVVPESGSNGIYTATWVPDNIGEINITGASGLAIPTADTEIVITLQETGTVGPTWKLTAGGVTTIGGGEATPGWPLAFNFYTTQQSQYPFELHQPGSSWSIWCYKDY